MRRPRRNRRSGAIRALVRETVLRPSDLVLPIFLLEGEGRREPVASMPGVDRLSIDLAIEEAAKAQEVGVKGVLLFPVIPENQKDEEGSQALNPKGLLCQGVGCVKRALPDLCVMADIALDPYTSHGHDGLVHDGEILNDETVEVLAKASKLLGDAGVDFVAPSDMMDGRIRRIREVLDEAGHQHVSLLSYSAKYASAFYGPFRDALGSAPRFGDKRSYQMDPANVREAVLEALLDEEEHADVLMIKPALPYLDVITKVREVSTLPIAAYQVSGEYSMIMAAAQNGWADADRCLHEALLSIKRAGADMIFTYAASRIAKQL